MDTISIIRKLREIEDLVGPDDHPILRKLIGAQDPPARDRVMTFGG